MKKTVLLSLIASTMIMAGGDIAPVVEAPVIVENTGDVFGQFRSFYVDRTYSGLFDNNRNSLATGGYIGYKSADFSGFSFAVALYGVFGLDIHDVSPTDMGASTGRRSQYDPSLFGGEGDNYGFIGQAYLNYAFGNTNIKAGRQRLDTPLAGADDARMLPNLFEAVIVTNKDIEGTTLLAGHLFRETVGTFGNVYGPGNLSIHSGYGLGFKDATSGHFKNMGDVALGNTDLNGNGSTDNSTAGVTAFAAIYSNDGLKLQVWDYIGWDILNAVYLQADYAYKVSDMLTLKAAGQYIHESDIGGSFAGDVDSNYWAGKLGAGYGNFSAYVAYSQTGEDNNANNPTNGGVITPWGGMPAFTQGMVTRHMFLSNTDAWKIAGTYNFKDLGLKASVYHAEFDVGDNATYAAGVKSKESGFDLQYKVAAVDGLNLRFRGNFPRDFTQVTGDSVDWNEYRLIINYNF